MAALALAAAAVAVLVWEADRLPVAAFGLSVTWGLYAYCKRTLPIGPNQGFLLEVLLLAPPALALLGYLAATGRSHFFTGDVSDGVLLLGAGAVTAVPLMVYANGAKLLRLSTIAMLQYIAPTMIFLIAVLVFGEALDRARLIAFPMIWTALAIFTASAIRQGRRQPAEEAAPRP
jgi:chloramphenicol-sensitive protein RarD